jgi:hypothetical protein
MQYVSFIDNYLTGRIPSALSVVTSILALGLSGNHFTGKKLMGLTASHIK